MAEGGRKRKERHNNTCNQRLKEATSERNFRKCKESLIVLMLSIEMCVTIVVAFAAFEKVLLVLMQRIALLIQIIKKE